MRLKILAFFYRFSGEWVRICRRGASAGKICRLAAVRVAHAWVAC
jgi:hypothetical protein